MKKYNGLISFFVLFVLLMLLSGCVQQQGTLQPTEPTIIYEKHNSISVIPSGTFTDSYITLCLEEEKQYDITIYLYDKKTSLWEKIGAANNCYANKSEIIVLKNNNNYIDLRGKANLSFVVETSKGGLLYTSTHEIYDGNYAYSYFVFNDNVSYEMNEEIIIGYQVLTDSYDLNEFSESYFTKNNTINLNGNTNLICITLKLHQ